MFYFMVTYSESEAFQILFHTLTCVIFLYLLYCCQQCVIKSLQFICHSMVIKWANRTQSVNVPGIVWLNYTAFTQGNSLLRHCCVSVIYLLMFKI